MESAMAHHLMPHLCSPTRAAHHYPWSEYRALLLLSDSDHYSDAIMERMDHFQIAGPQTLILREIQQHLVLCHQLHL
ncbi:hypothetical protein CK203_044572 [Vitis vinifera]|uniref:Uncharacterized protein n=1 Tax=Vitis vinifera TaxID=29760 RepID=A0A438HJK7_VITVI|nr:hypothetical protein CK203_044572 [Vitis vinifera]